MAYIFFIYLFVINVVTFGIYGTDKRLAVYGMRRISESALLSLAAMGGAYGAAMGMWLFHHKTHHTKFNIVVPLCLVAWLIIVVLGWMSHCRLF